MSLDVSLMVVQPCEVYSRNITHNLTGMADEAGLYKALWRPEEIGVTSAKDLIPILEEGLTKLIADPGKFKAFNPPNKWGSYEGLVDFVRSYLAACREHPEASVSVYR